MKVMDIMILQRNMYSGTLYYKEKNLIYIYISAATVYYTYCQLADLVLH